MWSICSVTGIPVGEPERKPTKQDLLEVSLIRLMLLSSNNSNEKKNSISQSKSRLVRGFQGGDTPPDVTHDSTKIELNQLWDSKRYHSGADERNGWGAGYGR